MSFFNLRQVNIPPTTVRQPPGLRALRQAGDSTRREMGDV